MESASYLDICFDDKSNNFNITQKIYWKPTKRESSITELHNLIKNALEAIEEKGQIDINLHRVQKNNTDFIEIALYDDGVGIKEQQLEQIFEPYVTTKIKGTGLGLAIVKKIIEEHGGAIWVDASRKIGAGFIIQLPAL